MTLSFFHTCIFRLYMLYYFPLIKSARGTSPETAQQPAFPSKVLKLERWVYMGEHPSATMGVLFFTVLFRIIVFRREAATGFFYHIRQNLSYTKLSVRGTLYAKTRKESKKMKTDYMFLAELLLDELEIPFDDFFPRLKGKRVELKKMNKENQKRALKYIARICGTTPGSIIHNYIFLHNCLTNCNDDQNF